LALVTLVALATTACRSDDAPVSGDDPTTSTSEAGAASDQKCLAPTYSVEPPDGWEVNGPAEAPPCRYFHPEPFEVPQNTEVTGIAVRMGYEETPFEVIVDPDPVAQELLDRRDSQIDGKDAVRLHLRSTGEGLLNKGVELVQWVVRAGDHRTFTATTIQAGAFEAAGDFEANIEVLDAMVESLEFSVDEACSAAEMVSPVAQVDLPDPVAKTRSRILEAALSCDYAGLAGLAELPSDGSAGRTGFTFSYGGSTDFGAFLEEGEDEGLDPLRKLVQVLGTTPREFEIRDEVQQVWPAAATYESWAAIPKASVDELGSIYTAEDLQSFARAEQYLGYRTAISTDGDWLYFVAGD
jgi:hypothetical protein